MRTEENTKMSQEERKEKLEETKERRLQELWEIMDILREEQAKYTTNIEGYRNFEEVINEVKKRLIYTYKTPVWLLDVCGFIQNKDLIERYDSKAFHILDKNLQNYSAEQVLELIKTAAYECKCQNDVYEISICAGVVDIYGELYDELWEKLGSPPRLTKANFKDKGIKSFSI